MVGATGGGWLVSMTLEVLLQGGGGRPAVMLRLAPDFAAVSTVLTLAAKRKEQRLSKALSPSGFMLTNMSVLPLPPRHGWSR